ncbi:MAG TPA: tRNA 2-thiouridine(34) synthase MnmA [Sphingomicrobium sp.]|nr:tRNA 2-thiouridine(34) synthase MnmA [Sphingomicrobium sp.]
MPVSFDLSTPPRQARIVVAMSGGVDSSVTAALAARTGAQVIGVTLQLYDHGEAVKRTGSCCAGQDIYDAKEVADRLGIAHYVLDYESRFREGVIDRFADEYARGRTPIPCALCNQGVKFTDLIAFARELGADCLATGHYVRRVVKGDRVELHKGADGKRDQSYFLYGTTAEQLEFLRFPLGGLPKSEVRRIALETGLAVASKPDSQDICFVPDGDYASLVKKLRPHTEAPGEIVDLDGRVLGEHRGVVHFTIGQRRGIDIGGSPEPLYVVRIDPGERRLVVGPRSALAIERMRVDGLAWIGEDQREVSVKVRSLAPPVPALVENGWVIFDRPEYGVAPGQAAVFYDGSRVLGGGWIAETRAADPRVACAAAA